MGKSILTQSGVTWFRNIPGQLAACLLPQTCLLCGALAGNAPICKPCQTDLPQLPARHCPLCLEATTHGERCGACLSKRPHFDQVHALHAYAFPLDQLIHQLKYSAQLALAPWWGSALATGIAGQFNRVIPLPLHPKRLEERGFNQAQEIARHLARTLNLPLDIDSLQKTKATQTQAELPLKARKANLSGAFECMTDLEGQHILLVDDVLTTGATLDEAARVLKLHGASHVTASVVARTLRHA